MKKIQVVTKPNCSRCSMLKEWFHTNQIEYTEWPVENPKIQNKLLHDPKFTENYCDIEGCKVFTPILRIDESGEYYSKHLFGIDGLRIDFLKEKLEYS